MQTTLKILCLQGLMVLLTTLLGGTTPVWAQTHLKGQRFTQLSLSRMDRFSGGWKGDNIGYAGEITLGKYTRNLNAWPLTIGYAFKDYALASPLGEFTIPVEQFYASYGYQWKWYRSANRLVFVTSTASGVGGYELLNKGKYYLYDSTGLAARSRFMAGIDLGFDVEVYNVVIGLKQRWVPTSQIQKFHTFLHIGYRFHH